VFLREKPRGSFHTVVHANFNNGPDHAHTPPLDAPHGPYLKQENYKTIEFLKS
jgi:hypothetical protein